MKNESPLKKDNQITASSSKTKEKSMKQTSTEEVSSSSASCSTDREFPHMSDRLIGHHGGDLLSFYQHSNRCDLIIGLVIQKTHVSVMESYLQSIRLSLSGENRKYHVRLKFSKEKNIFFRVIWPISSTIGTKHKAITKNGD